MKRLVLTRADKDVESYTHITHPIIKDYANRCSAEFKILEDCKGLHKHYRILQLYDLFKEYDRILMLDSDMLIRKDCPNLFEVVHYDCIGLIYEDIGTREADRRNRIKKANELYGDNGWSQGYINTGTAIFSKAHQDLFKYDPNEDILWMENGYDDVFLGYRIHQRDIPIFKLDLIFNFMSMFTEPWCGMEKSKAYIIHYAGMGHHPNIPKPLQIMNDYLVMRKHGML